MRLLKTFKERRQQKLQEKHPNVPSLREECKKHNENFGITAAKNMNEVTTDTTAESPKIATALNMTKDLSEKSYRYVLKEVMLYYIFCKSTKRELKDVSNLLYYGEVVTYSFIDETGNIFREHWIHSWKLRSELGQWLS